MDSRILSITGAPGVSFDIRTYQAGDGPDLLYLHGAGGLLQDDPFMTALSKHFRVYAPLLPGYEDSHGSDHLRDMIDFALLGWDIAGALNLDRPLVAGHSMGGMIAAEMAALAPESLSGLALLCPAGLWRDEEPVEDIFAKLPFELPGLLFHDPEKHGGLLAPGGDLDDPEYLTEFMVANARRLGTAAKLLFPIPDRGLRQRLYRISAPTEIIWGESDNLIPPGYADEFAALIDPSTLTRVEAAGHMVQYEQTETVVLRLLALSGTVDE